jgi:hypothetical protein
VQRPWLSVLVPAHNVRQYLAPCIESIFASGTEGIEVLVLDDCSTDGSYELAMALQARYGAAFRLLRHPNNQGVSAARNSLLAASTGDYLWFVDSDDLLMPGAMESLQAVVAQHQPDLVMCDFRTLRDRFTWKHRLRGELHRRTFAGPHHTLLTDNDALLAGAFELGQLHLWSKVAHRSLWAQGLQFPVGHFFEDVALVPALLLRAKRFVYCDEVWVGYRQRAGSILATRSSGKNADMMRALACLPLLQQGVCRPLSESAKFQASYFAAKSFVNACRFDSTEGNPDQLLHHLAQLHACSLMPVHDVVRACLRHGWYLRGLRLAYWLRRAGAQQARLSP